MKFVPVVLLCVGCYGIGGRVPIAPIRTHVAPSSAVGDVIDVNPGESIFVSGKIGELPAFEMSGSISSTMPGAYSVPFDFSIEKCVLIASFESRAHRYYAAPFDKCDARHTLLGKVIVPGDSVGLRISKDSSQREWYVDNSCHNQQSTVWHRPVTPEDHVEFVPTTVPVVDANTESVMIVYGGCYGGSLHFSLCETIGAERSEREFQFDLTLDGPTPVNIKGAVFEVLTVNNLGMKFRWLSVPLGASPGPKLARPAGR